MVSLFLPGCLVKRAILSLLLDDLVFFHCLLDLILDVAGVETLSAIATGAVAATAPLYKELTAATDFVVWAKGAANDTSTSGGYYISDADSNANKTGYLVVEICYIQPDDAPGYEDIDGYLTGRTVS